MKKFFTLLSVLVIVFAVNAQSNVPSPIKIDKASILTGQHQLHKLNGRPYQKPVNHNASRNTSVSVMLDYPGADGAYATVLGTDEYYVNFLDINKNYPNSTNLTHRWGIALFDTLVYIDQATTLPAFLPRKTSTLTLDSFDLYCVHENNTGRPDTIQVYLFESDSMKLTGTGATANLSATHLWDTTIITSTSLPLNVTSQGTPTWTALTFYPNVHFPQGKSFGMRVDFAGDTANKFNFTASFRDDCLQACIADPSAVNNANFTNSLYYVNAVAGGTNLSGINSIGFNCGPPCEEWYPENWWIYPYITADVQLSAAIVADSLKGCPGTVLNLAAFGFGSDFSSGTYSWSTTSGTISDPTGQTTQLTIDSAATVTVVVTDNNNQTVSSSINIVSNAIKIRITDANPITLTCGGSATIHSTVGGITTGKTYLWSNGTTTANATVTTPGLYTVTVTNNKGCSATASINVNYSGVTNNVNFTVPTGTTCQNSNATFTNTSSSTTGWNATWDMKNDGSTLLFTTDANYAYPNPGVYVVKLTMDSAGCSFVGPTHSITVTATQSVNPGAPCYVQGSGIEDVNFSNSVNVVPNPTHGNVTVTVNGVDKNISIRIYNVIGSEVKSFISSDVTSSFSKSFDLTDLSSGAYLVKIQTGDKTAIKRLTVSK